MKNYEIFSCLYKSQKSIIFKVRSLEDNNLYILKKFLVPRNQAIQEIKQHTQNAHFGVFIASVIEYFEDVEARLVLVMEYCNQGDLNQYLMQHITIPLPEKQCVSFLAQLAYLLLQFAQRGTLHRAIVPENILITGCAKGEQIRLTDFGLACVYNSLPSLPPYQPPEQLFYNKFTHKSHIWQLGLVMYYMLAKKSLIRPNETKETLREIYENNTINMSLPSIYSKELKSLIRSCLNMNEDDRPSIIQLMNSENYQFLMKTYKIDFSDKLCISQWLFSQTNENQNQKPEMQIKKITYDSQQQNFLVQSQSAMPNLSNSRADNVLKKNKKDFQKDHRLLVSRPNVKVQKQKINDNKLIPEVTFYPQQLRKFQMTKFPIKKAEKLETIVRSKSSYQSSKKGPTFLIPTFSTNRLKTEESYSKEMVEKEIEKLISLKISLCVEVIGKNETINLLRELYENPSQFQNNSNSIKVNNVLPHLFDVLHLIDQKNC